MGVWEYVKLEGEKFCDHRSACLSSWIKIEKSELPFGSRWVVVDKKRPQKMKEPVGWVLGRREAARKEYKLMMHTQSPFRRVRGMKRTFQSMLIRLGCVRIGPRCTYSVPLLARPAAFNLDFFATDEKSSTEFRSPMP